MSSVLIKMLYENEVVVEMSSIVFVKISNSVTVTVVVSGEDSVVIVEE